MKYMKLLFASLTILFGVLGLSNVLSYDVSMPIMIFTMASTLLINSFEFKKKQDNVVFVFLLFVSLFAYGVLAYTLFF